MFNVDHHVIARQVGRKRTVVAVGTRFTPLALRVPGRLRSLPRGLVRSHRLLQVLQSQLQLLRAQLLRATPELMA